MNENIEDTNDNSYLDTKFGFFKKDQSAATMYVGNLNYEMDELHIKDLFEEFGIVNYVKLIKDPSTHESKGIAFVQMVNPKDAKVAISVLNGCTVGDRKIKVSFAEQSSENAPDKASKSKRRKPYKAYVSKAERGTTLQ